MSFDIKEKKNKINSCKKRVNLIFKDQDIDTVIDKILEMSSDDIINEIRDSDLRGRGGAGFPTWIKFKSAKEMPGDTRYVVCNADEGEPGTFKDREIIEKKPEKILAGMTAVAKAIGSNKGIIYLRAEYGYLLEDLQKKVELFNQALSRRGFDFTVEIRSGSGAYVCGEGTSLIESIEGKRSKE